MKLSVKITIAILVITLLVFVASGYVMFRYFSSVLLTQLYRDDQIRLNSIVTELDAVLSEAEKYANHLSLDRVIQGYLSGQGSSNVTARYRELSQIREACLESMFLSQYMHSAVVINANSDIVGTFIPYNDDLSQREHQRWYAACTDALALTTNAGRTISRPYLFSNGRRVVKMVSVVTPCFSLQYAGQRLGSIVVNIEWSSLQGVLARHSQAFDAVALLVGEDLFVPEGCNLSPAAVAKIVALQQPEGRSGTLSYYRAESNLGIEVIAIQDYFGGTQSIQPQALVLLLIFTITVLLVICILVPVLLRLTQPAKTLALAMKQVGAGKLETRVHIATHDEFADLGSGFNRMIMQIDQHLQESLQFQKDKHRLEYEVLVAQINPHFIYNTLNSIVHLARKERCGDIMTLTGAFISLLQDGIQIGEHSIFSTVEKELRIIRNYMCIQNYRYKDLFLLEVDCADELLQQWIPCSLLQPLVENALFHGIAPLGRQGRIWLSLSQSPATDTLTICVADEGLGITQEQLHSIAAGLPPDNHRNHIGLQNVRNRLALLYGDNYYLEIAPRPAGGTQVTMRFATQDTAALAAAHLAG